MKEKIKVHYVRKVYGPGGGKISGDIFEKLLSNYVNLVSLNEAQVIHNYDGPTYVMMPHFLGGSYASMMTAKYGFNINKFLNEKEKHIKYLKERRHAGHEHPKTEKHR